MLESGAHRKGVLDGKLDVAVEAHLTHRLGVLVGYAGAAHEALDALK
jgi:hypothetical protein